METLQMMISVAQQNPMMLQMFGMTPQKLIREINKLKKREERGSVENADAEKRENDTTIWKAWLKKYRERLQREVRYVQPKQSLYYTRMICCDAHHHFFPSLSTYSGVSEEQVKELNEKRVQRMNQHNPKFVLRNYIAQNAIERAGTLLHQRSTPPRRH
jgi:uncharacterized protein YdiU (UPF0061 family)